MSKDLIVIDKSKGIELFNGDAIDKLIAIAEGKVSGFKSDTTTEKGRKEIASNAYQVSRSKTLIDGIGKDFSKKIKLGKKKWIEAMDRIRDEVRAPLDKWEKDEDIRVTAIKDRISAIRGFACKTQPDGTDNNVMSLRLMLDQLEAYEITEDLYSEFIIEAENEKNHSTHYLEDAIKQRQQYEDDQEELERLRTVDRERNKQDALVVEQDTHPLAAEETGSGQERPLKRLFKAKKKITEITPNSGPIIHPIAHKKAINRKIHAEIIKITGIKDDKAKHLVIAIAKGEIPNLTISY